MHPVLIFCNHWFPLRNNDIAIFTAKGRIKNARENLMNVIREHTLNWDTYSCQGYLLETCCSKGTTCKLLGELYV